MPISNCLGYQRPKTWGPPGLHLSERLWHTQMQQEGAFRQESINSFVPQLIPEWVLRIKSLQQTGLATGGRALMLCGFCWKTKFCWDMLKHIPQDQAWDWAIWGHSVWRYLKGSWRGIFHKTTRPKACVFEKVHPGSAAVTVSSREPITSNLSWVSHDLGLRIRMLRISRLCYSQWVNILAGRSHTGSVSILETLREFAYGRLSVV